MFTLLPFTLTFFTATFRRISADLSSPSQAAEAPGSSGRAQFHSPRADQAAGFSQAGDRDQGGGLASRGNKATVGRKSVSLDALEGSPELGAFSGLITLISAPKWQRCAHPAWEEAIRAKTSA